jgi:ABC-type dipeptide/oligopeptide/nickel transport system permease component
MTRFIVQRILGMFVVLISLSLVTFFLMRAVPGGPFDLEKPLPQATIDQLNAKYNLDAPIAQQYFKYIGDILLPRVTTGHQPPSAVEDYLLNIPLPGIFGEEATLRAGNFGPSYKSRSRSVTDIFRENLPVSAQLGLAALAISIAIGAPLGVLAALNRNNIYDYASMGIAITGVSVPVVISAPLLQYFLGVQWRLVPVSGWGDLNQIYAPAFALGFVNAALIARLTRASLLQVLSEDYIRTARAKGLPERLVVSIHALKNSMIPLITILGPLFAALMTGTFVVESWFSVPGMGRFFVTSITGRDYPVIMGTILLYAFILIVLNMLVDIAYAWLDPRIRY